MISYLCRKEILNVKGGNNSTVSSSEETDSSYSEETAQWVFIAEMSVFLFGATTCVSAYATLKDNTTPISEKSKSIGMLGVGFLGVVTGFIGMSTANRDC